MTNRCFTVTTAVLLAAWLMAVAGGPAHAGDPYTAQCPTTDEILPCVEDPDAWGACPREWGGGEGIVWTKRDVEYPGYAYPSVRLVCEGVLGSLPVRSSWEILANVCEVVAGGGGFRCERPLQPHVAFIGRPLLEGGISDTREGAQFAMDQLMYRYLDQLGDVKLDIVERSRGCVCVTSPCACDQPEYWAVARFQVRPSADAFCGDLNAVGLQCEVRSDRAE